MFKKQVKIISLLSGVFLVGTIVWQCFICWQEIWAAPDAAVYDFLSGAKLNARAYEKGNAQPLSPINYENEANDEGYSYIMRSDGFRWTTALADADGEYDSQIFTFLISQEPSSISQISASWEGYGETQADYYTYLKIWNSSTSSWEQLDSKDFISGVDQILTGSKATNISNYIDGNSKLHILATTKKYAPPICGGRIWGGYCWYEGAVGKNCTEVCATHGGNAGTCQEDDNYTCDLCHIFYPGADCGHSYADFAPHYWDGGPECNERQPDVTGSCSASDQWSNRFCACNN